MTPSIEFERPVIKTELPGPRSREIIEADGRYVTPSYPRPDYKLVVERAHGVGSRTRTAIYSWTATPASPFVRPGIAIPEVVAAITKQANEFIHFCGDRTFTIARCPSSAKEARGDLPAGRAPRGRTLQTAEPRRSRRP